MIDVIKEIQYNIMFNSSIKMWKKEKPCHEPNPLSPPNSNYEIASRILTKIYPSKLGLLRGSHACPRCGKGLQPTSMMIKPPSFFKNKIQ